MKDLETPKPIISAKEALKIIGVDGKGMDNDQVLELIGNHETIARLFIREYNLKQQQESNYESSNLRTSINRRASVRNKSG